MQSQAAKSSAVLAAVFFLVATGQALAQPAAVTTAQSANTDQQLQKPLAAPGTDATEAPLLYEGEMEDVGPQYVLQPQPKPKYYLFSADWQLYYTNNAALAPGNKEATDVNVFSVSLDAHTLEQKWWDEYTAQFSGGFHYQYYVYGLFTGRDAIASGTAVNNSDFYTLSPYAQLSLKRDDWSGTLGLRYTDFLNHNNTNDGNFYWEWVPYFNLTRQFNIAAQKVFQISYDLDYRRTDTQSGGLQPSEWNDRMDNAISFIYSYIVNDHLVLQPSFRLMNSLYTYPGRHRSDVYATVSFVAAYYFNDHASARAFTSWEQRDSSEIGNDYQNWNLGIGGTLQFLF